MKNRAIIFVLALVLASACMAADPKYPVSAIPKELLTNANVVFREDHAKFTILSKSKASYYVRQVITILNAKGKKYASEVISYDKLSKVKTVAGAAYDQNGKLIKRLKNSEIYDQSAFDGFSLYSDNRLKAIDLHQTVYPYTVEFEYEVEYKFLFFIPGFYVVTEENVSVERSSYTLIFPPQLAPRYKTYNIESKPESSEEHGLQTLRWPFENIKPFTFEALGPDRSELIPHITAAPSVFEYESYSGNMKTWEEFGKWIQSLSEGRDALPEETKQKIKRLTQDLPSTEEKIKAVYSYLQSKTRYVSIQLGIGGLQPFEASLVDKTGYGDCKALSNYMVSMLQTIGIPSHYVLIYAGGASRPIEQDLPSSQFNHAVVAVPNGSDTLWLECTSQSNPFGYQGRFTGDRNALAITETGAEIINTTRYPAEVNVQSRTANVSLGLTGDGTAIVKTTYSGLQYENGNLNFYLNDQYDDQKKWILENTSIPSFDINAFSFKDYKNRIPSAVVSLDLTLNRYGTTSGKRIFFSPNLMNKWTYIPPNVESRKSSVVLNSAFTDYDTIQYALPDEIYPEFLPEGAKLKTRFGEYETSYKLDQGKLIYTRTLKMCKGEFPPDSYQELIDFYRAINKSDNTKMVFMSKT